MRLSAALQAERKQADGRDKMDHAVAHGPLLY